MLIPSSKAGDGYGITSLSRRVNANSQQNDCDVHECGKLIKKGEC